MNFKEKFAEFKKIKEELDDHIWGIFSRYKEMNKILFSGPELWEICDNYISFHGEDGCKGCYDQISVDIPMSFFEDPNTQFKLLEEKIKQKTIETEDRMRKEQEVRDHREFERLKTKFGVK